MGATYYVKSNTGSNKLLGSTSDLSGKIAQKRGVKVFSYTDARVIVSLPFSRGVFYLPGMTLLSHSTHRDTYPVHALGNWGIKGFTTGHRTVAGTFGFDQFGEEVFIDIINAYGEWLGLSSGVDIAIDELPPMEINLVFVNEFGEYAGLTLRGVKIIDSSTNINIQDIKPTEVYSYIAASINNLHEPGQYMSNSKPTITDYVGVNDENLAQQINDNVILKRASVLGSYTSSSAGLSQDSLSIISSLTNVSNFSWNSLVNPND